MPQSYLPIIIGSAVGAGLIAFAYKKNPLNQLKRDKQVIDNMIKNYNIEYKITKMPKYEYDRKGRVYKYKVKNPTLEEFSEQYWESLMGNYKHKENIDNVLKKYLENNKIDTKYLFIKTPMWASQIEIENNTQEGYTFVDIKTDCIEQTRLDAASKSLENEIKFNSLLKV